MGLSPIRSFLRRHRHIALDTSIFIYHVEANHQYATIVGDVFSWLAPDLAIAAAELRAVHSLRTPDALQAATAVASGAKAFLTNDKSLLRLPQIEVCSLDEMREA